MTGAQHPFDVGLQLERTTLAWRRTALALAVAAVASVKVLFDSFGYAALAIGAAGAACALALALLSSVRYRKARQWLNTTGEAQPPMPGASALALCTALVGAVGLIALAYVL